MRSSWTAIVSQRSLPLRDYNRASTTQPETMNPLFADDARKAAQSVRDGLVTAVYSMWGWVFLCDAQSEKNLTELRRIAATLTIAGSSVIIDHTGKLNKHLRQIPEFAEEMMSFSEKPLIVWFESALNVHDSLKDESGAAPFMLATDDLLSQVAARCGRTLYMLLPLAGDAGVDAALKSAGSIIPLQRRRQEPFLPSMIRFRADGSFQLEQTH